MAEIFRVNSETQKINGTRLKFLKNKKMFKYSGEGEDDETKSIDSTYLMVT